jgi:hypothetical protein
MDGGDCDDGYICVVWSRCYRTCCTVCHTAIASMQQSPAIAAAIASNSEFCLLVAVLLDAVVLGLTYTLQYTDIVSLCGLPRPTRRIRPTIL